MARKILRKLYNRIAGRPHFDQEDINFEGTKELLQGLSGKNCVGGKIVYYHPVPKELFRESTNPIKVHDLISENFKPRRLYPPGFKHYFEGNHQVYFGDKSEMHYIEISTGATYKKDYLKARGEMIKKPYKRATLEFLIRNS